MRGKIAGFVMNVCHAGSTQHFHAPPDIMLHGRDFQLPHCHRSCLRILLQLLPSANPATAKIPDALNYTASALRRACIALLRATASHVTTMSITKRTERMLSKPHWKEILSLSDRKSPQIWPMQARRSLLHTAGIPRVATARRAAV